MAVYVCVGRKRAQKISELQQQGARRNKTAVIYSNSEHARKELEIPEQCHQHGGITKWHARTARKYTLVVL